MICVKSSYTSSKRIFCLDLTQSSHLHQQKISWDNQNLVSFFFLIGFNSLCWVVKLDRRHLINLYKIILAVDYQFKVFRTDYCSLKVLRLKVRKQGCRIEGRIKEESETINANEETNCQRRDDWHAVHRFDVSIW